MMKSTVRRPRGRARFLRLPNEAVRYGSAGTPATEWRKNLVMYDWAAIVARLLTGDVNYKLGAMYIEFENVASPGDPVAVPTYGRDDGKSYYDGLAGDPARDYLRVPIFATGRTSSDETLFPLGNVLNLYARTAGVVGVNGLPFTGAANSTVFGAALVATPDFADQTQDLIFSRFYCEEEEQQGKSDNGQIASEWELVLE